MLRRLLALGISYPLVCLTAQDPTAESSWETDKVHGPAKEVELTLEEGTWMNLDVSPDGKTIVFDLLGDIYSIPMKGGEARCLLRGPAFTVQPRFSPDGAHIAFTSDAGGGDNLWVMKADGSDRQQVTKESFRLLNNPCWTADGKYLIGRKHFTATRSLGAGELWMYPLSGGPGIQLTKKRTDQHDCGEPETSPDGRYVYYSEDISPDPIFEYNRDPNGTIYAIQRLDLRTGEKLTLSRAPGGSVRPEVSPGGKRLAFVRRVRDKSVLMIRDLLSGEEVAVFDGLSKDGQETWSIFGVYPNFAWTPDGKHIVIWAKGKLRRIDVATKEVAPIPFLSTSIHQIREALRSPQDLDREEIDIKVIRWPNLSPDGKTAYFQALGQIYVKKLPDGKPERLTKATHREYHPQLSADGRKLVYTSWDDKNGGFLMLYDFDTGESRQLLTKPGHYAWPSFDAFGERVIYQRLGRGSTRGSAFVIRPGVYVYNMMGGVNRFLRKQGRKPRFHPTEDRFTVLESEGKDTALCSYDMLGQDRRLLATSRRAEDILLSPDADQVIWEELFHIYLSPMPMVGGKLHLSPERKDLPVLKLSQDGGTYAHFSAEGTQVLHSLGARLFRHEMKDLAEHKGEKPPEVETLNLGFKVRTDRPASNLVLTNVRLLTMHKDLSYERKLARAYIHIVDNKIAALGPMDGFVAPAAAKVMDLSGKTVMPGIVDVHAHMRSGSDGMLPQNNWSYLANLAFGVTCTHDPSHDTEMVFAASELEKTGMMLAPRIFSTGTILYGAEARFKAVINSKADAARHLRRMKAWGAFSVKSYNQPRRNQRQQVIEAAAELDMMVVPEGGSMFFHNLSMILDGHTTLEHALPVAPLYEDVLQLFAASKTAYNPTLVVGYGGIWGENYWYQKTKVWESQRLLNFVPRSLVDPRARRRTMFPENEWHHIPLAESAAKLIKRGVVASVSAHGQMQGLCSHWDLWMFQQGGLDNYTALRTATINPARALGFDAHVGSLAVGKLADLVVLNANPVDDIRNSEKIHLVMKNGRLYDAMTLAEVYPRQTEAPKLPFLGAVYDFSSGCSCHVVR